MSRVKQPADQSAGVLANHRLGRNGGPDVADAPGRTGEVPKERPLRPYDVLATMYRHLGIDPHQTFLDHSGRPVPILHQGKVIPELV